MTEGGCGRKARLAGMDVETVSEAVRLRSSTSVSKSRDFEIASSAICRKPVRLGHFSGVLAARGAIYQEDARGRVQVAVARLRALDRRFGFKPLDRQVITRIVKSFSGLARARRLSTVPVGLPRHSGYMAEFLSEWHECRIRKLLEQSLLELSALQPRTQHTARYIRFRHL